MDAIARLHFGLLRTLSAVVVLGAALLMAQTSPAAAQGFGWFGGLLGVQPQPQPQRMRPAYPGYGYAPDGGYYVPRRRAPRHRAVVDAPREEGAPKAARGEAEQPPPPKKDATVFVYVIGDSLGQLLANGLDDALSDRPEVGVAHKAKGSTGLVTNDFFDWPKAVEDMLASKDKIDVAVMMIGSNDRQSIREDGKTYEPGSDEWNAIYKGRVTRIDEAFRKKGIPLVWVGVPITRKDGFADDMAAFNEIYREAAAASGATYVDTWEAFSDDNGNFDAFGPDINGQTVRLRSADGIHFTKAGARKLAHFVETHVRRDLDGKAPVPQLPTAEAPAGGNGKDKGPAPVAVVKPDAGPISNLNEPPAAARGTLATPTSFRGLVQQHVAADKAPPPQATPSVPNGRADDFRWPANGKTQP